MPPPPALSGHPLLSGRKSSSDTHRMWRECSGVVMVLSTGSPSLRSRVKEVVTLLVNHKRAEKKAREIEYIPLVTLTPMALEIDHRDLTNRVTTLLTSRQQHQNGQR